MHVEMWTNLPDVGPAAIRRMTRAEFDHLVHVGSFRDEKLELIRGVIVRMSPQDPDHSNPIVNLTELLLPRLLGRARVRVQLPLIGPDESEPEPDIAVVPLGDYAKAHPAHALLLIEVSRSRLGYDRGTKGAALREMGAAEYWIVDVGARVIEVRREPSGDQWNRVDRYVPGQSIELVAFPDLSIAVADVFA